MPADIPVTIPVADPTETLVLAVVQVPPAGVDNKVVVSPAHTLATPVIAVGNGLIVMEAVPLILDIHSVDVLVAATV